MFVLNECKVKYSRLDEIIGDLLKDIRLGTSSEVIVDVKEVVKKYFRPDMEEDIADERIASEEIASDIINIISHYRNYLAKNGKYSTFYFLYSFSQCEAMKAMMPDYKKYYYDKYFLSQENAQKIRITEHALRTAMKVINAVPNCSFLDTSKCDEMIAARKILSYKKDNQLAIILSNDEVMYQLLSPSTVLINMKGIKSSLATDKNAVSILADRETDLSSKMIPLIASISGNEKYSIQSLPKVAFAKAINAVEYLIKNGKMEDAEYIGFPIKKEMLDQGVRLEKIIYDNYDQLESNYRLIRGDAVLYGYDKYLEALLSEKHTKGSAQDFLDMNAKIFLMFPLQLSMLLAGEKA